MRVHTIQLTCRRIDLFRKQIYDFYGSRGRKDLPWRLTRDPYRILVSEFMLQQTQVQRVLDRYGPFIERFPGFEALARSELRDVLEEWSGLGYNRRAKMLRETARAVVEEHGGALPVDPESLAVLPGIGPATAGAVSAFAFDLARPFIETNIRTVFIHFFFEGRSLVRDDEILPLVERTLDRKDPRSWYYALMDYGVMLKGLGSAPNTRSVHYTRQGRFEGSDRQARGLIIRALTAGSLDERELREATGLDGDRFSRNTASLAREGMIELVRGKYSIA